MNFSSPFAVDSVNVFELSSKLTILPVADSAFGAGAVEIPVLALVAVCAWIPPPVRVAAIAAARMSIRMVVLLGVRRVVPFVRRAAACTEPTGVPIRTGRDTIT